MSGGRNVFTCSGVPVTGLPRGTAPDLLNTSYTITADIEVPQGGGEGMIVEDGGRFGGYDERKTRAERKAQDRTGPGHNSEGLRVQGDGGAR
jgi:hypothetical protein